MLSFVYGDAVANGTKNLVAWLQSHALEVFILALMVAVIGAVFGGRGGNTAATEGAISLGIKVCVAAALVAGAAGIIGVAIAIGGQFK